MSCNDNDNHAASLQNCCATDWHKPGYGEFPEHNSFWLLGSHSELEINVQPPSCQGQFITKSHEGYLACLKIIRVVISCLIPKGLPEIWTACTRLCLQCCTRLFRDQYGCGGLTLAGCQVPTKAALSLPFSTRHRRENRKRLMGWDKNKERSLSSHHHMQNRLVLGKINWIYCQSNQRRNLRNKTKTLKHLPLTPSFFLDFTPHFLCFFPLSGAGG